MKPLRLAFAVLGAVASPLAAQDADELAAARGVLAQLQDRSFAENREYCG